MDRDSFLDTADLLVPLCRVQMPNCGSLGGPWYLTTMRWVPMDVDFNASHQGDKPVPDDLVEHCMDSLLVEQINKVLRSDCFGPPISLIRYFCGA